MLYSEEDGLNLGSKSGNGDGVINLKIIQKANMSYRFLAVISRFLPVLSTVHHQYKKSDIPTSASTQPHVNQCQTISWDGRVTTFPLDQILLDLNEHTMFGVMTITL